jgi:hypothetical protein
MSAGERHVDWAYKAVLTATTVALLLTIAQLFGRRIAGVLAGLPTVTGPALIWLALERGTDYAVEAATGSIAACALCAVFALAYERASHYRGVSFALLFATAASLLPALPLQWAATGVLPSLLLAAAASLAAWFAMPDGTEAASPVSRLRGELGLTALVSGGISGAVALCAPVVDPFWAGVLASPPLIAAVMAMREHVVVGHASVQRFLRGYAAGLMGRAVFGAGFALLLVPIGVTGAALLAAAAGCAFTLASMRMLTPRPARAAA